MKYFEFMRTANNPYENSFKIEQEELNDKGRNDGMGQLIKLHDYISRYEMDHLRYPGQFVRLKNQQWMKLKNNWQALKESEKAPSKNNQQSETESHNLFKKVKRIFRKERDEIVEHDNDGQEYDPELHFSPFLHYYPDTEEKLKQVFLDQLLTTQIKWASTTIWEQSFVDPRYYRDEKLRHFLQRFPDTFLLFYKPVFLIKKVPVETDILFITPTELWCLSFLEEDKDGVYIGSTDHFWSKRSNRAEKKVLNPIIGLNRTANIIHLIFKEYGVDMPVKKGVITRKGFIDFPGVPYDVSLLDSREYPKWFQYQRNQQSPIKHMQLRAVRALLDNCQTTCVQRYSNEIGNEGNGEEG